MKVIHLISGGDVGGAKTHVLSLLAELQKEITVKLVCFCEGPFADDARALGIDTTVIPSPFRSLSVLRKLISEYDVIHCHGSKANVIAACIKPFVKAPIVTTIHSDYRYDYMGRPLRQLTFGNANALALRCADWYIPVSSNLTDVMIETGYRPQRMLSVKNSVDFASIAPPADRKAFFARHGFNVSDTDVVIGFAGRLTPIKDIPTMLRAVALARKTCQNLKLFLAGEGEDMPKLKALAKELGIEDAVCFAGWLQNAREMFSCVDISAMSSKSEGFPYALLEGVIYQKATVSSRVGGIPDLVEDEKTGFLFEVGDAAALAEYFVRLTTDKDPRTRLGKAIYEKAKAEYSLPAMRRDQIAIYRKMLAQKHRPKRDGVVICGAYGKGNAGDDAILEAIISEMRGIDRDMPITVMSKSPKATRLDHRVNSFFTFNIFKMHAAFRKAKLYINGGGSLIQDVTSSRSLYFYLYTLHSAKHCGCNVMMYGCGIGPLIKEHNIHMASKVLDKNVDIISLREDESLRTLQQMGVNTPHITLTADPALTLKPSSSRQIDRILAAEGIPTDGNYLCLSMRPWDGFELIAGDIARCADYAYETYGMQTVLLPIEVPRDLSASEQIASRMQHKPYIIRTRYTASETIGLMSRMRAVMAMRLHALVFAATTGIPIAGIAYDKKVGGFMEYLGQSLYTTIEETTYDKLCAFVDVMAAMPHDALNANADRLRALEAINVTEADNLLKQE